MKKYLLMPLMLLGLAIITGTASANTVSPKEVATAKSLPQGSVNVAYREYHRGYGRGYNRGYYRDYNRGYRVRYYNPRRYYRNYYYPARQYNRGYRRDYRYYW